MERRGCFLPNSIESRVGLILILSLSFACGGKKGGDSTDAGSTLPVPDTTAPLAPIILSPAVNYLSKTSSLVITGSCEDGATVFLSGAASATGTCSNSSFSFTVSQSSDGIFTFNVAQTDAAGNSSTAASVSWTRDTVPPGAPATSSPTANPFTSGDDAVVLSGTCESLATVNLTGAATASTTCSNNSFSFNLGQTADGAYDYSLTQTDVATNVSNASSFQWVRDTTIPATPTITAPSNNPSYSNTDSIVISGACTTNDTVKIGGDLVAGDVTSPAGALTQTCTSGAYSFSVQKTTEASYTFLVSQENTTTLTSSADASLVWVRDTGVPAAPVITNPSSSPYTSSGSLSLSGTCETGTTVNLSGDSIQSAACAGGTFAFSVSPSLDGTYNFSVTQTDLAGNTSAGTALQWVRDSSVTPSPSVLTPSANSSSNSSILTISGSCNTGLTITLGGDVLMSEVSTPAGSLSQTCADSAFSFAINKSADGTYALNLKQTSPTTGDSALVGINWTLDTSAPDTSLVSAPADPNLSVDSSFAFSSPDSTATFECQMDSGSFASCASPMNYAALSPGSHTFTVRARDSVGNIDASPATHTWTQAAYKTVALYHANSGSVYSDSSLFSGADKNDLTDTGGTTSVAGFFADGLNFNSGSNQFVSKTDNNSLESLNAIMTFEGWFKFATLPGSKEVQVLASKSGASGSFGWEIQLKSQGVNYNLTFIGSLDGSTVTELKSSNVSVTTSSFHHIAVTWNKGSVKFYFNGVARGGGTVGVAGSSFLYDNTAPLRLGATETMGGNNPVVSYFNGVMDEVRLSQVLRWTSNFTPPNTEYGPPD